LGEHDYYNTFSTRRQISTTNLVWRTSRGVLGDWAGCVWWHTQSLDNVFIVDFIAGHPGRIFIASVLVAQGVVSHQWLHDPLHEAEGYMFSPQPGFSQGLDLLQQLG
jgi:hypothetical protein